MSFWDASALVPLCVVEPRSGALGALAAADDEMVVWWAASTECASAIWRRYHTGIFDVMAVADARTRLEQLRNTWDEIPATTDLRVTAERLLGVHPLRAADALQLAAAIEWSGRRPSGLPLVSLDNRLRDAALREGFTPLP